MEIDEFKNRLGDWGERFEPFFFTGQMDLISNQVIRDSKRTQISPKAQDVFAAFKKCSLYNLKAIFVGLAPYASFYNNKPVSDGLAFSCSVPNGQKDNEQPSLKLVWDAVFDDLEEEGKRYNDLSFWAYQGVLLLNVALTAKKNKPDSHVALWEPFMQYLFEEILGTETGLPIVFFGKEAAKIEKYTLPMGHYIKKVEHPAFSARQNREFKHDNLFSWVNRIAKDQRKEEIKFIVTQDEYDSIIELENCPF
jgi:uracil-DNA glycosylase